MHHVQPPQQKGDTTHQVEEDDVSHRVAPNGQANVLGQPRVGKGLSLSALTECPRRVRFGSGHWRSAQALRRRKDGMPCRVTCRWAARPSAG
jgi:hypothetical protein